MRRQLDLRIPFAQVPLCLDAVADVAEHAQNTGPAVQFDQTGTDLCRHLGSIRAQDRDADAGAIVGEQGVDMILERLLGLIGQLRGMKRALMLADQFGDGFAPQPFRGLVRFHHEAGFHIGQHRGIVHLVKQHGKAFLRIREPLLHLLHKGAVRQ